MTAAVQRRGTIPCMDGIRGLACLIVLVPHAVKHGILPEFFMQMVLAKIAIIVFFALSGFMMMYHYYLPGQVSGRYWCGYFTRRFFRIYPAYIFTILISIVFQAHTGLFFIYMKSYLILKQSSLSFSHLWTIPPEVAFYIIFPFISVLLFIAPVANRWKLSALVALCIAVTLRHHHSCMFNGRFWAEQILINNLQYFIAGIIAAFIHIHYPLTRFLSRRAINIATIILTVLVLMYVNMNSLMLTRYEFYYAMQLDRVPRRTCMALMEVTLVAMAIMAFIPHSTGAAASLFTNRFMRYCGAISFSLYLIHPLVFALCSHYLPVGQAALTVIGFSAAFLAAVAMHICIEKPSNRFGKKLSRKMLS